MGRAKIVAGWVLSVCLFFTLFRVTFSSEQEDLDRKRQEVEQLQQELNRLSGEKQTLSSTINYLNGKIKLTQTQIDSTEQEIAILQKEIDQLAGKIKDLDLSLTELTNMLVVRINETYKQTRIHPMAILLTQGNLGDLVTRYKYVRESQRHSREIIYQLEVARTDYDQQKQAKQEKQDQLDKLNQTLEAQKSTLARQQVEKQKLLEVTKSDEKRFQVELAKKLAELEAIQSIIAGRGDETEAGDVSEGARIAGVIPAASACSSGAHLHFEVAKNGAHHNPADYLSGKDLIWDNSPDGSFGFGGSWPWPLNDPIRLTQGYGMTFYASVMRYYGGAPHTGIDMVNNADYAVKAARAGKLYRGAIACGGGTLRYVRVDHGDELSTYYLHVNY